MEEVRIDKWLWAVRIFKTRSIATQACKLNRVFINDQEVKPSRMVHIGDIVKVKKAPITYSFEVLGISQNRMGAKLVPGFMKNITPKEEYEVLEMTKISGFVNRAKGLGRPTKRERREMEQFGAEYYSGELESWGSESNEFDWDE